jgi:anthranilate synthase component 1
MKDVLKLPESFFMLYDTIVAFDHFFNVCKVITYVRVPESDSPAELEAAYKTASATVQKTISKLQAEHIPLPPQPPIARNQPSKSNIGQTGYESHVTQLKKHISKGGRLIHSQPR